MRLLNLANSDIFPNRRIRLHDKYPESANIHKINTYLG
jgi:hypothetical protein